MRTLRLDINTLRVESFDVDSQPLAFPVLGLPTLVTRMAACCEQTVMAQENE